MKYQKQDLRRPAPTYIDCLFDQGIDDGETEDYLTEKYSHRKTKKTPFNAASLVFLFCKLKKK